MLYVILFLFPSHDTLLLYVLTSISSPCFGILSFPENLSLICSSVRISFSSLRYNGCQDQVVHLGKAIVLAHQDRVVQVSSQALVPKVQVGKVILVLAHQDRVAQVSSRALAPKVQVGKVILVLAHQNQVAQVLSQVLVPMAVKNIVLKIILFKILLTSHHNPVSNQNLQISTLSCQRLQNKKKVK